MIAHKNFTYELLYSFMKKNDDAFQVPFSKQLSNSGQTLESWCKKICSKGTVCYESDENALKGLVIGFTENIPAESGGGGYISVLVVAADFKHQGIGYKLLCEYINFAKSKGLNSLWLTTGIYNTPAQRLYEKAGFKKQSCEENVIRYQINLTHN